MPVDMPGPIEMVNCLSHAGNNNVEDSEIQLVMLLTVGHTGNTCDVKDFWC